MPKYVIERDIPGAGNMSADQLSGASVKSCSVLDGLGNEIQWIPVSYTHLTLPTNREV